MSDKQQDQDLELVKKSVAALGEHFDTVQIFATRHEAGTLDGTISVSYGCGNWFARYGKVREWIIKEEESAKCEVRRERDNP